MSISGISTSTPVYRDFGGQGASPGPLRHLPGESGPATGSVTGEDRMRGMPETQDPAAAVELDRLKQRDAEVKTHEHAHIAAGGPYVQGGARYSYEKGADGRQYAVGGEVSIDTSPENDPAATLRKMQVVKRAALAPANPSAQDRSVAARADAMAAKASAELRMEKKQGNEDDASESPGVSMAQAAARYAGAPSSAKIPPPAVDLSA